MTPMSKTLRCVALVLAVALGGCATHLPRPWERGHLAAENMAWSPDALRAEQRYHTYISKEAAAGGADAGGGGCGCTN